MNRTAIVRLALLAVVMFCRANKKSGKAAENLCAQGFPTDTELEPAQA